MLRPQGNGTVPVPEFFKIFHEAAEKRLVFLFGILFIQGNGGTSRNVATTGNPSSIVPDMLA